MLKLKIASLDEVDEAYHSLYRKVGDSYVLDVEQQAGDPPVDNDKGKLAEFRDNNIALKQELDELKGKLEGIDPEIMEMGKAAIEKARNEKERMLIKAGRFDDVFNMRLVELKDSYEKKLDHATKLAQERETTANQFRDQLRTTKIESYITREAGRAKLAVQPTAVDDFVRRALDTFDINDKGEVVAWDRESDAPRVNREQKPFSVKDFFEDVIENAPHLVAHAEGSEARGPGRRPTGAIMTVDSSDVKAFGANIDAIAKGKVQVRMNQ